MIEAVVAVALRAILASVLLGGALAALVLLATRTLSLSATTRHALWTTALVAMGLMPLAGIGVSVVRGTAWHSGAPLAGAASVRSEAVLPLNAAMPATSAGQSRHPASHAVTPAASQNAAVGADAFDGARRASPAAAFASFFSSTAGRLGIGPKAPPVSRTIAIAFVALWALGALIGLIGLALSVARVRGLKKRSSPLDAALADELPWLTAVGPGREIYLRLSYEIETPVAIGFSRPVILIPTELATADGLAAIESLVLHEHAHLRRYDDWTNLVQRTIERIFWFNPIVWLVGRRIALEREIASDDAVVEKTGEPHAYATSLWQLAREMRMPEHAVVAPGALLTRKQISVRIEQLLDKRRARLHRSPAAALGITLVGMLAVAAVATSAPAVELPVPLVATAAQPPAAVHHVALAAAAGAGAPVSSSSASRPAPASNLPAPPGAAPPPPAPPARGRRVVDAATRAAVAVAVASAAAESARAGVEIGTSIGASVSAGVARSVRDALASIPHDAASGAPRQIAQSSGGKVSRELLESCTGCALRNADLRNLDLHGLKLTGLDLRGADLRGTDLSSAKLTGVDLRDANLTGTNLRGASLSGVELRGASLDGAQLDDVRMIGTSLRGVSLRNSVLRSVLAHCIGCDLSGLDLHGQDLHGIALTGADLSHADLHDADLHDVRFAGVDLQGANLSGANLTGAHLDGCDLSGTSLGGAKMSGIVLHGTDLGG